MTQGQIKAKQRIFDAAVFLFARKGFAAVSVREIATKARVNIAMINYYYGGKAGILKAIVNACYEKYYNTIKEIGEKDLPLEEHVRLMIRTVVDFFRKNTEIAIIAFDVIPLDIPEILDLKTRWVEGIREGMKPFHEKLGYDTSDLVQQSVGPGIFVAIVVSHFQGMYAAEHLPQYKGLVKQLGDNFYDRYSDMLANIFLYGITGKNREKIPR
jgi:AcrR family transcriptional regulator